MPISLCVTVSISPLRQKAFIPDPGGAGSEQRSSCSSPEAVLPFSLSVRIRDAVIPGRAPHAQFRKEREAPARDHLSEAWRQPCSGNVAWLAYLRVGF